MKISPNFRTWSLACDLRLVGEDQSQSPDLLFSSLWNILFLFSWKNCLQKNAIILKLSKISQKYIYIKMTRRNVCIFSFLFSFAKNITHIEKKHAKLNRVNNTGLWGPGFESRGQPYPQCFHPTLGMWTLVEGWSIGSDPAIDITHAPAGSDTLRGLVGKKCRMVLPSCGPRLETRREGIM